MIKIPTIFMPRDDDRHLSSTHQNQVCDWVFAGEGDAKLMIDGRACMFDGQTWFLRHETTMQGSRGASGFIRSSIDTETQNVTGWFPVNFKSVLQKPYTSAINRLREEYNHGSLKVPTGTYELVGPGIEGNPYKMSWHELIRHSETSDLAEIDLFEVTDPWRFLKGHFEENVIQGIVWHHPDGRMAKIKRVNFGLAWPV